MALATIFENGKPIQVNEEFVEALINSKPNVYSKKKPEPQPLKKVDTPDMTQEKNESEGNADHLQDGQFTKADLMAAKYDLIKETAVKLGISVSKKKKELLVDEILEAVKPK